MDKTKTTIALFNKYANVYQDKYMNVDLYKVSFDLFCSFIEKENAEILDLACGPGNITKYLLNKRADFNILGIDLSSNMIELAKENNPTAQFQIMDCRDIAKLNKKYDAIVCGFCLPYLSEEEASKLIRDASQLLNPNGVLYISTMEDDYSKSGLKGPSSGGEDRIYTYYHQGDYLKKYLEQNGFKNISLQRQEFSNQNEETTIDLILISKR